MSPPATPIDLDNALNRLGSRVKLLRDMMDMFLEDNQPMLAEIEQAYRNRDAEAMSRTAHSLKSLVGVFDATECTAAALAVEQYGNEGDFEAAENGIKILKAKIALLVEVIETEREKFAVD
ncbi:MAG: Hpt domain-containing protein [Planctomycetales bacterium]|nr:Hpt domain-containing protein [Planctomycetales bacterium]